MMTMENSQLYQALLDKDVAQISLLLEAGSCSTNGNCLLGDPPIIECFRLQSRSSDQEDDVKICKVLELLVQHGADVNIQSQTEPYRATAAMVAAQLGYLKCLQFLVESKADLSIVSHSGNTALTFAAREGHEGCVKYLVEHSSHSMLEHKDKFGRTALMIAASYQGEDSYFRCVQSNKGENNYCLCVQHLLAAGAELDGQDEDGDTALMLALQCYSYEVMSVLLERGACVNTQSHSGETPLKLALQSESSEAVDLLLERGALVNDISPLGVTNLTVSNIRNSLKLLYHGADPSLSRRDRDCLHVMVKLGQKALVRGLIRNGFPPLELVLQKEENFKYTYGLFKVQKPRSPLSLAILSTAPDIAKYLILNSFFTPCDVFQLCWDKEILKFLESRAIARDSYSSSQAKKTLEVLRHLSTKLVSLRHLCLITITSVLSQDLCLDLPDSVQGIERWMCKPTFREKVELLQIPPSLQRALLNQTESASICCMDWGSINLAEKQHFVVCSCKICEENTSS